MKARTLKDIEKEIRKEERDKYLNDKYDTMVDVLQTAIEHTTVCALAAMERMGLSERTMKKFFDEIIFVYDYPPFYGKRVKAEDIKKQYEKKLGVDFSRIKTTFETKEEFVKKYR
jgi:hypothetical protein